MNRTLQILVVVSALIILSCLDETDRKNSISNNYSLDFIVADSFNLVADDDFNIEETSNFFVRQQGQMEFLVTRSNNHIYEFDLRTGNILSKLTIPFEGPNSMNPISAYDGIASLNDSTYLYVNHFLHCIYSINRQGLINTIYQLPEEKVAFLNFFVSTYAPLVETKSHLVIPNFANPRFD